MPVNQIKEVADLLSDLLFYAGFGLSIIAMSCFVFSYRIWSLFR